MVDMGTYEFLSKVHTNQLGRLDAFNKSFDFTNGDKRKVELLISEIDDFITNKKNWHEKILVYYFDLYCDLPIYEDHDLFFTLGYDENDFDIIKHEVDLYCTTHKVTDIWHYPYDNFEELFYPKMFDKIRRLKTDLSEFIVSQELEQTTPEKKQPKDIWGFKARYNFLDDLGVWDKLNKLNETEKAKAISQILGCNPDNAKKLKNGTYPTSETQSEQLERKQLIDRIKRTQTD